MGIEAARAAGVKSARERQLDAGAAACGVLGRGHQRLAFERGDTALRTAGNSVSQVYQLHRVVAQKLKSMYSTSVKTTFSPFARLPNSRTYAYLRACATSSCNSASVAPRSRAARMRPAWSGETVWVISRGRGSSVEPSADRNPKWARAVILKRPLLAACSRTRTPGCQSRAVSSASVAWRAFCGRLVVPAANGAGCGGRRPDEPPGPPWSPSHGPAGTRTARPHLRQRPGELRPLRGLQALVELPPNRRRRGAGRALPS